MSKCDGRQFANPIFMGGSFMNAVGIDVSKGYSTVTVVNCFGEVVTSPFDVNHTDSELSELAGKLKSLSGETKIIIECTGSYHFPIANALHAAGLTVHAVNAILIHEYGNNSIRRRHNDKADARKIARYGITNWLELPPEYIPEEEIRQILKAVSRQYNKYNKIKTMLTNNLISLLDRSFPGLNKLFTSQAREKDGHEKWIDFAAKFWHCGCVADLTPKAFAERYSKWCKRIGYYPVNVREIHAEARKCVAVMPKTENTKSLITCAVAQLNNIGETLNTTAKEMNRLAKLLPEYPVALDLRGVGKILGPQLIAEVGFVPRFEKKSSLVAFAGLEPTDNQSGQFQGDEPISKKGSPHLRKTLFQIMDVLLRTSPTNDIVYQLLDRKRAEGKHYYSYMCAGSAKLLRIYYARVKEHLSKLDSEI
jgi:transposase